jgi:hypothetical protein
VQSSPVGFYATDARPRNFALRDVVVSSAALVGMWNAALHRTTTAAPHDGEFLDVFTAPIERGGLDTVVEADDWQWFARLARQGGWRP